MLIPNLKSAGDKDFRFVENATIHITESTITPSNSLRQDCAKRLRETGENVVTVVSAMSCGACT
jgi:hypothetical protein